MITISVTKILNELGWGSHLLLTATPAATILIYCEDKILLRRGILGKGNFIPGDICSRAMHTKKMISLVNTSKFPGRSEFDPILYNLPAVIIYPLRDRGFVIVGGWSERCFTISDERWLVGWSQKLISSLEN